MTGAMRIRTGAARPRASAIALAALLIACVLALPSHAAGSGAPVVSAGADQTITVADPVLLHGVVSDDGLPAGLADLRWTWSQVSGPAPVAFDDSRDLLGVARFSTPGSYTLRLSANEGTLTAQDDVVVTVLAASANVIRVPQDSATIQAAIDAAPPRALILVSPGTYTETLTIAKTITLASTYYTTGDRALVDQTIIQAPSATAETIVVSSTAGPETQVIGFKVTVGHNGILSSGTTKVIGNHVVGIATDAVEYTSSAVGLVEQNVLENNGDDGVDLNYSETVLRANTIRGNSGDGVEFRIRNRLSAVSSMIFRGNDVTNNRHDGIQLIDDDTTVPTATRLTLDRNVIASNGQAGVGLLDGAVSSEDYRGASLLERIILTNNTIVGNAYGVTGGDNVTVVNNVFSGNTNTALKRVDGNSLVTYSIFWANGLVNDGSNIDPAQTLNADPLLDATYHLQSGSPAIDAGVASLTLTNGEQVVDIAPAQYNGAAPDLGRYETSAPSGNAAPIVNAGADQSVVLPASATLIGSVTDDGQPNPPGTTTSQWTQVAGPAGVVFGAANSTTTTADFPAAGVYTLRLTASDSALSSSDDVVVTAMSSDGGGVVDVRVAAGSDDAEQSASGSTSLTSTDLELVFDGSNQTVGLRFTGVGVPQGVAITRAYVQFQVDEVNTEATALTVRGQAADNASTFTSGGLDISGRATTGASAAWTPAPWPTIGAAGADQRTTDLSQIVGEIVSRPGWKSGNALVLVITGTGHRTAESFEGLATAAPLLHIEYAGTPSANRPPFAGDDMASTTMDTPVTINVIANDTDPDGNMNAASANALCAACALPVHGSLTDNENGTFTYAPAAGYTGGDGFVYEICDTAPLCDTASVSITITAASRHTLDVRVSASSDDAEESPTTSVSLTSSDLELVTDGTKTQVVGLRFAGLGIPRGAVVESAWVQFRVDEATSVPTSLVLRGQSADNASTFTTTKGNVSTRPRTTASVSWAPPSWLTVGAAGVDQQTPNLRPVIQEIVSRSGWQSGNALALIISGTGTRTATAFNKGAAAAPLLHIEYTG